MKRLKRIFLKYDMSDEEAELAVYGIYRLLLFVFGVLIALSLGWVLGNAVEIALFLVVFIPLRIFAGGIHLDSLWKCGIVSSAIIICVASFFKLNMYGREGIMSLAIAFGGIVHIILAPQDSENKRLHNSEKKKFARISRKLICIYCGGAIMALLHNWGVVLQIVSAAITVSSLSLLGAFIYENTHRVRQ